MKVAKRQQHVRPQRKNAQKTYWRENAILANVEEIMDLYVPNCDIKRATKVLLEVIKNTLSAFSSILTKKVIL